MKDLFRFTVGLSFVMPPHQARAWGPIPILGYNDTIIGFASLHEHLGEFQVRCAIDYSRPERLDLEIGDCGVDVIKQEVLGAIPPFWNSKPIIFEIEKLMLSRVYEADRAEIIPVEDV